MSLLARVLRGVADRLDPPPQPASTATPRAWAGTESKTLFERDDELEARRREDALALMDDDTLGYVLVRCRRDAHGWATMVLNMALEDGAWPAMTETLGRVVVEADRVRAES